MLSKVGLGAALIVLAACQAMAGGLQFNLEQSFTVKGLTGGIYDYSFADLNGDGIPEVLARDTQTAVVYSISGDSVITSFNLDTLLLWGAVFADVNRDRVPDIVTAYVEPTIHSFGYVIVSIRDGAGGFAVTHTDTLNTRFLDLLGGSVLQGVFTAADIDDDGYTELLLSVDSTEEALGLNFVTDIEVGFTLCYHSFPDSVLWRKRGQFTRIDQLRVDQNQSVFVGNSYRYAHFFELPPGPGSDYVKVLTTIANIGSDSTSSDLIDVDHSGTCNIDYTSTELNSFLCGGHLLGDSSDVEVLTAYHHEFEGFPVCPGEVFDSLQLYRVVGPDSAELVWSKGISGSPIARYFVYYPKWPGYYLRLDGGAVRMYEGATAMEVDNSDSLPSGYLEWKYPYADGIPRLASKSGQTISLYDIDVVTDVGDGGEPQTLPADFTLGNAYPNPFNPTTTISFDLPRREHARLVIIDVLGREVRTLVDRELSAGSYRVDWDGKDNLGRPVATGVYLYRLTAGSFSESKKMILVK
jgi:hypothetical protein